MAPELVSGGGPLARGVCTEMHLSLACDALVDAANGAQQVLKLMMPWCHQVSIQNLSQGRFVLQLVKGTKVPVKPCSFRGKRGDDRSAKQTTLLWIGYFNALDLVEGSNSLKKPEKRCSQP